MYICMYIHPPKAHRYTHTIHTLKKRKINKTMNLGLFFIIASFFFFQSQNSLTALGLSSSM